MPIDLGATRTSGISVFTYNRLKQALGLSSAPTRVHDVYQMLGWIEPSVAERLHIDAIMAPKLSHRLGTNLAGWSEWTLHSGDTVLMPDGFAPERTAEGDWILREPGGAYARMPADGYYFDYIESSFDDEPADPAKIRFADWPDEDYRFCGEQARRLYEETDKALVGDFGVSLGRPGSYENWFVLLALEPGFIKEYYDRKSDHIVRMLEKYRQAMDDTITTIFFGQDFGTQKGEMIAPEMFSELLAPSFKKVFDWIHTHTPWKVFLHCCGSIVNLIPILIDCGVDILNPVQTSAARMDPQMLKAEFGDRLVFWGAGVDTQRVLPFGTEEEIRDQVRERVSTLAGGGGFVFNPIHNIQAGVPAENIIACFDEAYRAGRNVYAR